MFLWVTDPSCPSGLLFQHRGEAGRANPCGLGAGEQGFIPGGSLPKEPHVQLGILWNQESSDDPLSIPAPPGWAGEGVWASGGQHKVLGVSALPRASSYFGKHLGKASSALDLTDPTPCASAFAPFPSQRLLQEQGSLASGGTKAIWLPKSGVKCPWIWR